MVVSILQVKGPQARVKWPLDQASLTFINNVSKVCKNFSLMIEEYDDDDKVVFLKVDFTKVCNATYSKLYIGPRSNKCCEDVCLESLNQVPCKFSPLAQKILEALITEEELTKTVQTLA